MFSTGKFVGCIFEKKHSWDWEETALKFIYQDKAILKPFIMVLRTWDRKRGFENGFCLTFRVSMWNFKNINLENFLILEYANPN